MVSSMMKVKKNNYFVITGAPGTGKTSLLKNLRASGYQGNDEPARKILSEQLAVDGPGLPSKNPQLFIQMMQKESINLFLQSDSFTGPVFFDRGLPDLVAYALRFGVDTSEFENTAKSYAYNPTVFILSPWKDIFINDSERKLSFEMSLAFHQLITKAYKDLKYQLVEVPMASIQERAQFIRDRV